MLVAFYCYGSMLLFEAVDTNHNEWALLRSAYAERGLISAAYRNLTVKAKERHLQI